MSSGARAIYARFFAAAAFFAGAFLAGAFFAAGAESRLFFSAAIRSITFDPLVGASELVSWITRLPFFFCFSAISAFKASM